MSNYSSDPAMVRVDFFKPSGKWAYTEQVRFLYYDGDIKDVFRRSINAAVGDRFIGLTAVCLEPHHEHAHPLMMEVV